MNIQPVEILLATVDYLRRLPGTSRRQERIDPTSSDRRETTDCRDPASPSLPERLDFPLTDREQEIALLVGQGLSNKDIADRLHISTITVRHHLTNLFGKLGISTRLKLLRWVHQKGLRDADRPSERPQADETTSPCADQGLALPPLRRRRANLESSRF